MSATFPPQIPGESIHCFLRNVYFLNLLARSALISLVLVGVSIGQRHQPIETTIFPAFSISSSGFQSHP
jgi:hypothetical protein